MILAALADIRLLCTALSEMQILHYMNFVLFFFLLGDALAGVLAGRVTKPFPDQPVEGLQSGLDTGRFPGMNLVKISTPL